MSGVGIEWRMVKGLVCLSGTTAAGATPRIISTVLPCFARRFNGPSDICNFTTTGGRIVAGRERVVTGTLNTGARRVCFATNNSRSSG